VGTEIHLIDADDGVDIILADGSLLTVSADGVVALFLDPEDEDPATVVNMYVPDEEY
jgi:hypothetical protein